MTSKNSVTSAAAIIDGLGGPKRVAVLFSSISGKKVRPDTVSMWKHRDWIPWRWHLVALRAAREGGLSLTADELSMTRRGNMETSAPQ